MTAEFPTVTDSTHRAWASISLPALTHNLSLVRSRLSSSTEVICVVKGNAYGHGMPVVATHLFAQGVTHFAVATLEEAAQLRALLPTSTLMLLGPLHPSQLAQAYALGLILTISSFNELHALQSFCLQQSCAFAVQLHVDTGLGREGLWHAEALTLARDILACPQLSLVGIFSHLAQGSEPDFTDLQRRRFAATVQSLPVRPRTIHIDASDGITAFASHPGAAPIVNSVRLGRLLYGVATPDDVLQVPASFTPHPVLSLHARIALIKDLPSGTTLGYNRTYTLQRPSRIAIVSAGYLDGIPTALGGVGHALVAGQRAPIVGRVSMDMLAVDITSLSENIQDSITPGSIVTFIGTQGAESISLHQFASAAGMVIWEALGLIGIRVPRVYLAQVPTPAAAVSHTISA